VGGRSERSNLTVVRTLCAILDEIVPMSGGGRYDSLITFVKDRPGHDFRYAIHTGTIERSLGWHPRESFETGIRRTVRWYLDNPEWVAAVTGGDYREWISSQYPASV
jgi:dTDP-glucose 4,6-dehydratase